MQRDLDVVLLGDAQRGVERASVGPGVLVHLETADAALDERFDQSVGVDDDDPRPRKPMLTGHASNASNAVRSPQGELTPTPHTGPNSWPGSW